MLVYNPITFNLGAVISCPSGNRLGNFVEIAFLPRTDSRPNRPRWDMVNWGVVMENGWTRLSASDAVAKTTIPLSVGFLDWNYWLSQANHIFKHLGISSNFEDYVLLDYVRFCLQILPTTAALPKGFLFLCPPEDFRIGFSSFKWPECPAYWSLDPFGANPRSWKDAASLGFPSLRLSADVFGRSWDASVYAGICQFHQAKGFDPDSQDVALHLGHLLYELSSETHIPFAHIHDRNSCVTCDGDERARVMTEAGSENGSESSQSNHGE
ncbi:hypothetical protein DFH08DRAFT_119496 [Mycena albidolilacea]|uniref:Uncharacterized protein n=1 Tax=Mycena albidolilacea TaxID=1033008 RepID=A0AAD7E6R4_9AGAR|nr:hypothetical protein DFH08DRAFT_119496 [Mycena albidolilacea]